MANHLSDDQLRILAEFRLPSDRPITNTDLIRPGEPRSHAIVRDFGHLRRLKAQPQRPFPEGRWLSENIRIYLPSEMATWLLGIPTERPTTAAPVKSTVAHRKKPPKAKPKAEPKKRVRR
jgi:hypothetical protein